MGTAMQEDERAADDHFVGEWVENSPQRGHLAVFAGVIAVEPIGAGGDDEQHQARYDSVPKR